MPFSLDEQAKLYAEHLNNGGLEEIQSEMLLESIANVEYETDGKLKPDSVNRFLRMTLKAHTYSHLIEPFNNEEFVMNYRSFLQKSIFFDQTTVKNEIEFDKVYQTLINSEEKTLFRGMNEAKYRIMSSIQRFWLDNECHKKKIEFSDFLKDLIEIFKKGNDSQMTKYFEKMGIPIENDLAIMSYLQHYGSDSKTPLIDWTYNLNNALYFAASCVSPSKTTIEIDDYFSIYFIEEKYLIEASLSKMVSETIENNYKESFEQLQQSMKTDNYPDKLSNLMTEGAQKEFIMFYKGRELVSKISKVEQLMNFPILYLSDDEIDPRLRYRISNNMNIINQEGVFIWNSSPSKPLEQVGKEEYLKEKDGEYYFSQCLNIHKDLKDYILEKLNSIGINKKFIYPDNDDISNRIYNKNKENYGL